MNSLKNTKSLIGYFLVYFILCVGTFLMLRTIAGYATFRTDTGFLAFKQDYIHITLWKTAFYIHVFSAVFALMAGFTQFSKEFLQNNRKAHRLIGRLYAWNILAINFPVGLIMAWYANGHWPSKTAFFILDFLWFGFTAIAVIAVRKGDIARHRRFMIRSYALTFSAITLRSWKFVLSRNLHIDPLPLYMIDAWMGFVPNLLFAEWLISTRMKARIEKKAAPVTAQNSRS